MFRILGILSVFFVAASAVIGQDSLPIAPPIAPTILPGPSTPAAPIAPPIAPTILPGPSTQAAPIAPPIAPTILPGPSTQAAPIAPPIAPTILPGPSPQAAPIAPPIAPTILPGPSTPAAPTPPAEGRFWGSSEYLFWATTHEPIRVPLATSNNIPGTIAATNQPGTTILFGAGSGQGSSFDWFSGGRVTLGGWLDGDRRFGIEAGGFLLENRSLLYNASTPGAVPVLAIPFNATQPFAGNPAGPTAFSNGGAPDDIAVRFTSRLWGADINGLVNIVKTERFRLNGLLGFRYLDLTENFTLNDGFIDPVTGGSLLLTDSFGTRNQFYGGQLGANASFRYGKWVVGSTVKVALGANHEVLNVAGNTTVTAGAFGFPTGTIPTGLFAEPSNMGHNSRDAFAVVPEVQAKIGFLVTPRLQPFVGYNFLYLSNSLRPGNQLDNAINITQNGLVTPAGPVTGPSAPLPTFRSTGYWAQGVNFGLQLKF